MATLRSHGQDITLPDRQSRKVASIERALYEALVSLNAENRVALIDAVAFFGEVYADLKQAGRLQL